LLRQCERRSNAQQDRQQSSGAWPELESRHGFMTGA
jgi:hypothetical protein